MKRFITILSVLIPLFVNSQIVVRSQISDADLFKEKIIGKAVKVLEWNDKKGQHYLVFTTTKEKTYHSKSIEGCEDGCSDKELHVYHFSGKDSLKWHYKDTEKACPFDIFADFRKESTKITDIDKDGESEIWFMYTIGCTSDVSPSTLKLVMYRSGIKFMVNGTSQPSKQWEDKEYGGKYEPGKNFNKLSQAFKSFSKQLWLKNLYDR